MTLKIIWSAFAETQLDEIYEYYQKKVSSRVAKKLMQRIINEFIHVRIRFSKHVVQISVFKTQAEHFIQH